MADILVLDDVMDAVTLIKKILVAFVEEIDQDQPKVIFHPGWNLARYKDSFYSSRAMHILNVLMGNIEIKGGLFIPKGAGDCGKKGIRSIDCGKPDPEQQKLAMDKCDLCMDRIDEGLKPACIAKCTTHALKLVVLEPA